MRVLDAYPFVSEAFSVIREEKDGTRVICDCPLKNHRCSRLNLWLGRDGRLMFHCFACGKGAKLEILRAARLSWSDTFPANVDWKTVKREIVARYPYRDENGVLLYETVRLEPGFRGSDKTFFQRRPKVPGTEPRSREEWVNGLYGPDGALAVRLVLYRLPELLASDRDALTVVVAGEKDVESLRDLGFTATTNVCGENAPWLTDYSLTLADRHVVVIEDRDAAGPRHASEVCGSLMDYAASVRKVRLPEKDSTAFLNRLRMEGVASKWDLRAALLDCVGESRTWVGVGA